MTTPSPEGTLPRAVAAEAAWGLGKGRETHRPTAVKDRGQHLQGQEKAEPPLLVSIHPATVRTGFPDPHGSRSRIWGL